MHHTTRLLTLAALTVVSAPAFAMPSLWFASASDPSGTPLNSLNVGGVGSTFDVAVWYSSEVSVSALEVLTAFDRSASEGDGATPLDGKVVLNGSATSAFGSLGAGLSLLSNPTLSGGASTGSGPRGYGLDASIVGSSLSDIAATPGRRLFTLSLKNAALVTGGSSSLSFYTLDDSGTPYTTYAVDTNSSVIVPETRSLTVQAVPEPASMLALAGGLAALLRRRKGKA